jgi:DNA-binding transcriptional MocR family regulator
MATTSQCPRFSILSDQAFLWPIGSALDRWWLRVASPLIEDVFYNDLAEQDDQRRTVRSFDTTGHVMMCGSFSKTIAPGFGLAGSTPGAGGAKLVRLEESTSGSQATMLEQAMADVLTQPGIEAGHRQMRRTIAAWLDEARGLIAQYFPEGTRVTEGGFILWIERPHGIVSLDLFQVCCPENIVIAPGKMFSAMSLFRHCIRLGLDGHWDDTPCDTWGNWPIP